jgi:hypothetical protein
MTWPIGFSSLIGCSFLILEEAVNPESAKDSVRYPSSLFPALPNEFSREQAPEQSPLDQLFLSQCNMR